MRRAYITKLKMAKRSFVKGVSNNGPVILFGFIQLRPDGTTSAMDLVLSDSNNLSYRARLKMNVYVTRIINNKRSLFS